MKAVVCKEYGPPQSLAIEELPDPKPGSGEVLVRVIAAGVNFPDTLIIQGKYQFQPPMPFAPGGEVAGVVEELGPGAAGVKVGDKVIAFAGWGGFAEKLVVNAAQLMPIPEGMAFHEAAAFLMTYGTSHYALKDRARLKSGETLLVLGAAGGVGIAAVEIGKLMGAKVIAAASSNDKLEFCKAHGADELINYATDDLTKKMKEATGGNGADVIYDPVGGDYAEPAIRSLAWEGRYLVVGFAAGEIPKIPLNLYLLKGASAMGVFWGSFVARDPLRNRANLDELAAWFHQGKLKPTVTNRYPLEKAADALQDLLDRKIMGKAVIDIAAG